MHIQESMSMYEKLNILTDAAKYDVACTSSGTSRKGDGTGMGTCEQSGICHSFSADGRCISLLKILFTNECIYDCRYCVNRRSNDIIRTSFTPDEVCTLTMEFYRRNYIEGLFLSSGILRSPDYTIYSCEGYSRGEYGADTEGGIFGGQDECESGASHSREFKAFGTSQVEKEYFNSHAPCSEQDGRE